jgi:hypothetical protein
MMFFSNFHKIVYKRLVVIDVVAKEEPGLLTEIEDSTISLHALTGIHPYSGKTTQLLEAANDIQLKALLNLGSTHNFIDSAAVECAMIPLWGYAGLHIAVANDDRLTNLGCCQDLRLDITGEAFSIDCYDLTLTSFDMVSGI